MNERIINDLAVKSGLAEDMGRGYKFPDNYLDFAELIVRECADMAESFHRHQYDMTGNLELHEFIREHFGVEE